MRPLVHHGPLLDDARTAVVSCAAVSLGPTEAAWTSFTDTATPDRALVLVTTVNCGATLDFLAVVKPSFRSTTLGGLHRLTLEPPRRGMCVPLLFFSEARA